MRIIYLREGQEDLDYWKETDPKTFAKIETIIANIQEMPFSGLGKPEPLKYEFKGCWSRRITDFHRLVYRIEKGVLYILQCRYHYGKD